MIIMPVLLRSQCSIYLGTTPDFDDKKKKS